MFQLKLNNVVNTNVRSFKMWTIVSKVADVIVITAASMYATKKVKDAIKSGAASKLYQQVVDKFKKDMSEGKIGPDAPEVA